MRKLITRLFKLSANRLADTPPTAGASPTNDTLHRRSETYVSLSANLMQCNPTPMDYQILFGELDNTHGHLVALWNAGIRMSWQHAKLLSLFLASHVHDHEESHGPIVICDALRPDFMPKLLAGLSLKQLGELAFRPQPPPSPMPTSVVQ